MSLLINLKIVVQLYYKQCTLLLCFDLFIQQAYNNVYPVIYDPGFTQNLPIEVKEILYHYYNCVVYV